jgi:hypothetical protein
MAMIEFVNNDQSSAMQLQDKGTIALHANSLPSVITVLPTSQFCIIVSIWHDYMSHLGTQKKTRTISINQTIDDETDSLSMFPGLFSE